MNFMTLSWKGAGAPETKYIQLGDEIGLQEENRIAGYASIFGKTDQGGDIVSTGAYGGSLKRIAKAGRSIKMLWQHDPSQPIGVWDEIREDEKGLWVSGRIIEGVRAGSEALALLKAGALDGLSIGYRTIKAQAGAGGGRTLTEIDLWEVSLVTFPMLPEARVASQSSEEDEALARALADVFSSASSMLTRE